MKAALLDWIRAKTGGVITSASDIVYSEPPSLTDLEDNGLVTKNMLESVIPAAAIAPVLTNIIGGTTANPVTINYGDMIYPTIICRNADGSNYAGSANNVDDGTNIILTGDPDSTDPTKFADTFTIILKQ